MGPTKQHKIIKFLISTDTSEELSKENTYYLGSRPDLLGNKANLNLFQAGNLEAIKDFVTNIDSVMQNNFGALSCTASANRYLSSICDQVVKGYALINILLGEGSRIRLIVDCEEDALNFKKFLNQNGFSSIYKSTKNCFFFRSYKKIKSLCSFLKLLWRNHFKLRTFFPLKIPQLPRINIVTWINHPMLDKDELYIENRYFGKMPGYLNHSESIHFLGQLSYGNPAYFNIKKNILKKRLPILLLPSFLRLQDVFYAFKQSLVFIMSRKRNTVFQGTNYSVFIKESLKKDFLNGSLMNTIIQYRIFKRVLKFLPPEAVVLYPFENQPWEKAMLMAANELKQNIKFVAHQFFPIAKNFLITNFSRYSRKQGLIPALFLTSDVMSDKKLSDEGFNTIQIGSCRYDSLLRSETPKFAMKNEFVALCCLFLDPLEAIPLASKAIEVTKNAAVLLWINCHPLLSPDIKKIIRDLAEDNAHVTFYDCSVAELLNKVSVVLYNSSTVCYEAALRGVPIIYVACQNIPNLDRFQCLRENTMNHSEIVDLIKHLMLDDKFYHRCAQSMYEMAKTILLPLEINQIEKIFL